MKKKKKPRMIRVWFSLFSCLFYFFVQLSLYISTVWLFFFFFSLKPWCVASLVSQRLKHLPAMWETWVGSVDWEDPLEKEMATHSSILAWRIPWTEEPGGLQSPGSQRVRHDWATSLHVIPYCKPWCVFVEFISRYFAFDATVFCLLV